MTFISKDENEDIYFDRHLVTTVIHSTTNATPTLRHFDSHSTRKNITSVNCPLNISLDLHFQR